MLKFDMLKKISLVSSFQSDYREEQSQVPIGGQYFWTPEKIVNIFETRPQSSKNAQKPDLKKVVKFMM